MIEDNLIYKVCDLYYEQNQTQQQISSKLGVSRIKVSRLLQQARTKGIVSIKIHAPSQGYPELEKNLTKKWKLHETILFPFKENRDELMNTLGEWGAQYASRVLKGNEVIGLTWGSSLSGFVEHLPQTDMPELRIVQMLGGLGSPESDIHSSDLIRRFSEKTCGSGRILNAPGVVVSPQVKSALEEDPYISETLSIAASADIAFIGIGTAAPDSILMSRGNILSDSDIKSIKDSGAVGDVSLRFFNNSGKLLDHPINKRIIGLGSEEIRKIPRVVALAAGNDKTEALKGALRSGMIDVLITDNNNGKKLMEET